MGVRVTKIKWVRSQRISSQAVKRKTNGLTVDDIYTIFIFLSISKCKVAFPRTVIKSIAMGPVSASESLLQQTEFLEKLSNFFISKFSCQ